MKTILVVLVVILCTWLTAAQHKKVSKVATTPKKSYSSEVVTVNLPAGEKFLGIMTKEDAEKVGVSSRGNDLYITEKRNPMYDRPRKITFWGPGSMPYSWEPVLYVQEH